MFQIYKDSHKIIGYFADTESGMVLCEGEACVIADSALLMQSYLIKAQLIDDKKKSIIKKTRFSEIMNGLDKGALYAFDKGSYKRFADLAKINRLDFLHSEGMPSDESHTGIPLVIVQRLY